MGYVYVIAPPRPRPIVTYAIIGACFVVFTIEIAMPIVRYYGALVPALILQGANLWTLITHMFLHADPLHILLNMWGLLIFGPPCEERFGSRRFLWFYLVCGVGAALFHTLFVASLAPHLLEAPCVGASGAIFGVIAAFILLWPKRKLLVFFPPLVVAMEAWKAGLMFLLIETFYALVLETSGYHYVAHSAHVGGFIVGALLTWLMVRPRRRRVRYIYFRPFAEEYEEYYEEYREEGGYYEEWYYY